jgi:hypothetical protein
MQDITEKITRNTEILADAKAKLLIAQGELDKKSTEPASKPATEPEPAFVYDPVPPDSADSKKPSSASDNPAQTSIEADRAEAATDALIQLGEKAQLDADQQQELKTVLEVARKSLAFSSMKKLGVGRQPHAPVVYLYDLVV